MANSIVRHGIGNVRPYLFGPTELLTFVERTFQPGVLERNQLGPDAQMVEYQIGDSVVIVNAGQMPPQAEITVASVYVYVEDVDATYQRALAAGATSIDAPEDRPYAERGCGVRDCGGNTWWIARFTG